MILGGTEGFMKLYVDNVSIPASVKELVIDGVEAKGTNGIITKESSKLETLVVGDIQGKYTSEITKLSLSNSSLLKNISMYGSSRNVSVIDNLDIHGLKKIEKITPVNVNNTINGVDYRFSVVDLNMQAVYIDNAQFRNAISLVGGSDGGNGGSLDAAKINITGITNGKLFIGAPGSTPDLETGDPIYPKKTVTKTTYFLMEILSCDTDEGNVFNITEAAKKIHSPYCYDFIVQSYFEGGKLNNCTPSCINFEHDGKKFHYHAPDNIGTIFEMSEFRTDKAADQKNIPTGTMSAVSEYSENKLYYKAGGKMTPSGYTGLEEGLLYNWCSSIKTIEHIGKEYRGANHDEHNPNDGCVIKVTFEDGTIHYFQPFGWNISSNTRTGLLSRIDIDTNHFTGDFAAIGDKDEMTSDPVAFGDAGLTMIRKLYIADDADGGKALNNKLFEWNVVTETGTPDISRIETNTESYEVDDTTAEPTYPPTYAGGSADDRIGTLILDKFQLNGSQKNLQPIIALTQLQNLQINESELQSICIQSDCANLSSISLKKNGNLGNVSWTIGNFTYKPDGGSNFGQERLAGFSGHRISNGAEIDWKVWLPKLDILKMSECNIRFYSGKYSGDATLGGYGAYNYSYTIRLGADLPKDDSISIGGYKKYKGGELFASDSSGTFNINNVELVRLTRAKYGASSANIEYKAPNIKCSNAVKVGEGERITIKIWDQGTDYYGHGFAFEFHPFG